MPRREAYSVREVAALLGDTSERYIWGLIESGALPSFKSGGRRLVDHEDLRAYIKKLRDDDQRAREAAVSPLALVERYTFEASA